MDFQKKPLDVENSTLSKFGERVLEVWKGATVYKGKMGCCMRGDKEGGVPSIRAARRDESEAAV